MPESNNSICAKIYYIFRQRRLPQHRQTTHWIEYFVYFQILWKVDGQPTLNSVGGRIQCFYNLVSYWHGFSQLRIDSFRNVRKWVSALCYQLCNRLGVFFICLAWAVVVHFLALLHVVWIHERQFHPMLTDMSCKRIPVMSCRFAANENFHLSRFFSGFSNPCFKGCISIQVIAETECLSRNLYSSPVKRSRVMILTSDIHPHY